MTKEEFKMMSLEEKVDWLFGACEELQRHVKAVEHSANRSWLAGVLDAIKHENDEVLKERGK